MVARLELNEVFLCYYNKPQPLCHAVKCELSICDDCAQRGNRPKNHILR